MIKYPYDCSGGVPFVMTNTEKPKQPKSLLRKISLMFFIYTVIVLLVTGVSTYVSQLNIYRQQCEKDIRNIGQYLSTLMADDGEDFKTYQQYYMDHCNEVNIPYDFDEYQTALDHFWELYEKEYPGQAFGVDVKFKDLSPEVKEAYFIYFHEYWLLAFEKAREAFNIPYSYYLVMKPDNYDVVYMIDGERTEKIVNNNSYLYLGDEYYNDPEKYKILWDTWFTGQTQNGFMEFDNFWGHTYAYYTPLVIDGETMGIVATEIDVATVNHEILMNTLRQLLSIMAIICCGNILIMLAIYHLFLKKTKALEREVRRYSEEKDVMIAAQIENDFAGNDEISSLGHQFASMILEIDTHIKNLIQTSKKLEDTRQKANAMNELANKDALTGIRNKNAYDKEVSVIEQEMVHGKSEFGVAMVDMNFLKRINDTYGHDKGNLAIQKLCKLVCDTFAHSPVFRIGGDEFVVLLKGNDYQKISELAASFNQVVENPDPSKEEWECPGAALGYALYDSSIDNNFASVFKRADQAMFEKKREMKALRED